MKHATQHLLLIIAISLILRASSLRAQTSTPPLQVASNGTGAVDLEFRLNGIFIAKGTGPDTSNGEPVAGPGSLLSADQGTMMLWFPGLSAFRAGSLLNLGYIGLYSTAFGVGTTASGYGSAAFGADTVASGRQGVAFGQGTTASGYFSAAFGCSTTASGMYSVASGTETTASGMYSSASGSMTTATGYQSNATGSLTIATGASSTASGSGSIASGYAATASGYYINANADGSFCVGGYNIGGGTSGNPAPSDPIFEVGNGTSQQRSSALTVHRNGSVVCSGVITAAPGGDIPMYTGN